MSTNRPPSCDLPPEFYDVLKSVKPCPFCDSHNVEMRDGYNMNEHNFYVHCNNCEADGPWVDTDAGGKWNRPPRRSEVMELLSLVDNMTQWREDAEVLELLMEIDSRFSDSFGEVIAYTAKLRKEIGE